MAANVLNLWKIESCRGLGHLLSSVAVGQRPRNMKSKIKIQMFTSRSLHKVQNRRRGSLGPLLPKQSKDARGNGKAMEVDSAERRTTAKDKARALANWVLVFKIHRGRQATHVWKFISATRGFDSSPSCASCMQGKTPGAPTPPPLPADPRLSHLDLSSLDKALALRKVRSSCRLRMWQALM